MKRIFFLVVLIILFLSVPSYAAFGDFVQAPAGGTSCAGVVSCSLAFAGNVTAGNTILVHVVVGQGTYVTVNDSKNQLYTNDSATCNISSLLLDHFLFRFTNTAAGATTVIAHFVASSNARVEVVEVSGIMTPDSSVVCATGNSATASSGNFTASDSAPLLVGAMRLQGDATVTAGSGYTVRASNPAGATWREGVELRQPGASGTYTASATFTSQPWGMIGVAYKVSTVTASPVPCNHWALIDPSYGGTDNTAPTATSLQNSLFGIPVSANQFVHPVGGASYSKFSDATPVAPLIDATHTLGGKIPCMAWGTDWPGESTPMGIDSHPTNQTGSYSVLYLPHYPQGINTTITWGFWYKTDSVAATNPQADLLTAYAIPADSANRRFINFAARQPNDFLRHGQETLATGCTGNDGGPIVLSSNTWYWVTMRWSGDVTQAIPDSTWVYDKPHGSLIGQADWAGTAGCASQQKPTEFEIGRTNTGSMSDTWGENFVFNKLLICYSVLDTCPFPLWAYYAVTIESAADGSGSSLSNQNVTSGSPLVGYCVQRDDSGVFVANCAGTWSLTNKTGGVVNGDLTVAGDSKSATFNSTAVGGTATIYTYSGDNIPQTSGTLTVTAAAGANNGLLLFGVGR